MLPKVISTNEAGWGHSAWMLPIGTVGTAKDPPCIISANLEILITIGGILCFFSSSIELKLVFRLDLDFELELHLDLNPFNSIRHHPWIGCTELLVCTQKLAKQQRAQTQISALGTAHSPEENLEKTHIYIGERRSGSCGRFVFEFSTFV